MYRNGQIYDQLDQLVIDIYLDYDLRTFPIDEKSLCRKMGIALVAYSEYSDDARNLLKKKSSYGFFVPADKDNPPTIFYNDSLDDLKSPGCIRQTIFHEIKHYVCEDKEELPKDDDLAEHFGRFITCPTPFLVIKGITNVNEIVSRFGVSATMAENISSAVQNRIARFGKKLFDYEKPLIEHLDELYYRVYVENV